ncbi:MAG: AAA family ATPase [Holosporaceae bacterium]|jgi:pilus assembly protein CpaE|nr:AAA family ATPase [Holosporaceae bacterium]
MAELQSDLPHNLMAFVLDPMSEQTIKAAIKGLTMAFSEVEQGGIAETVNFLKNNRTPKILIIDLSESDLPLGDIAKIREFCAPNVAIIAIGSRNDVGLFRDLKSVGVSDYLIKPLNNPLLLQRAIEIANGVNKEYVEKVGKVIYFVSSVGGAGATTVAANIGWILSNRHFRRTGILDMDFLYGTLNLMLDIKVDNAYLDIMESAEKVDDYFLETIFKKYDQRLYYLGGLVDLLRGVNAHTEAFEALINSIRRQFNYVLIDSQRDLSKINKICIKKSDSFVVMVEMSVASAQNTVRMLEFLESDQPGKRIWLVANKIGLSAAGALAKESFEKIINRKIDCVIPLDESLALAAANIGQPLVMSGGPLTEVLENLADNLVGKIDNQKVEQASENEPMFSADKIRRIYFDICDKIISKFKI